MSLDAGRITAAPWRVFVCHSCATGPDRRIPRDPQHKLNARLYAVCNKLEMRPEGMFPQFGIRKSNYGAE